MAINQLIAAGGRPIDFVDRYQAGKTNALNQQATMQNIAGAQTSDKINQLNLVGGQTKLEDYSTDRGKKQKAAAYYPVLAAAIQQKTPEQAKAFLQTELTPLAVEPKDREDLQRLLAMDNAQFGPMVAALFKQVSAAVGISVDKPAKPTVTTAKPGEAIVVDGKVTGTVPGGGSTDIKPAEYRQVVKSIGTTIAGAFGGEGIWNPQDELFVLKDTKLAALATAVQREAKKIWKDKYRENYKMANDAAYEALEKYQIDLPDAPAQGAQKPPTTLDWLENKYGPR